MTTNYVTTLCDFVNDYSETRKDVRNVKENIFSNLLSHFFIIFLVETQNLKRIFGHESKIDFPTFISSKFFEKENFTMPQ